MSSDRRLCFHGLYTDYFYLSQQYAVHVETNTKENKMKNECSAFFRYYLCWPGAKAKINIQSAGLITSSMLTFKEHNAFFSLI